MATLDYSSDLVDPRVVRLLADRHQKRLDPAYLTFISEDARATQRSLCFKDAGGTDHKIDQFLPLFDNHSELQPPFQRSKASPTRDVRVDWGVLTMIEEEGPLAYGLFGGERLLPFAALSAGKRNPDELQLADGKVDLVAFDYAPDSDRPSVVVWLSERAHDEFERWTDLKGAGNWQDSTRYRDFTVPVAENFDQFLAHLGTSPDNV